LSFTVQDLSKLNRIIKLAEKLVEKGSNGLAKGRNGKQQRANGSTRKRRTGRELAQFRKMLKAERKKGIPVAEMARKHGISTAYIYLL
jgi:DNA invertase Pin-like site-specific DNA recombinase